MAVGTHKGMWWLPEKPDERYPGILTFEPYGDLRLELIGGFDIETQTPLGAGGDEIGFDGWWPVIHGDDSGGRAFTLLNATATHTSGALGVGSVGEQSISALRGLEGIHLTSADEPAFVGAEIEIEYLLGWVARTSISASLEFEGRWNGKQTLNTTPVEEQTATFEDLTFTLRVPHEQFRIETEHAGNQRTVANREFAVVDVEAKSPLTLRAVDVLVKGMQDLVTLVATEPAGVVRRTLLPLATTTDPAALIRPVHVHGRQVFEPGLGGAGERGYHEYLFTLDKVDFAKLLPAWLTLHHRARLPLSMLFGTKYAPAPYTPVNLLTVAAAAEGLHRCLHDYLPLDADKFDAAKQSVLEAVPGKDNGAIRKLLHEQFQNSLTYRDRLVELTELPDKHAVEELLVDTDAWLSRLTKARNGTAHADDTRPGSRPDGVSFSWITEVTYYLLCLVLMGELQITAELQNDTMKLQKIIFAIIEFEKLISAAD